MITVWWTNCAASKRLAKELDIAGIRHKSEMNALDRRTKAEIDATRERDSLNWRRDQVLRIGTDVIQSASDARAALSDAASSRRPMTREALPPILKAANRIAVNADSLELLGANHAAALSRVLADTIGQQELWDTAYSLNRSSARDADRPEAQGLDREYDEVFISSETRELSEQFLRQLSLIAGAHADFNQAVKDELGAPG
jgi:hypothetical protein